MLVDIDNPKLKGQTLYHYTTQEGLLGIVNSRALWATSIHYLNDSTEFNYTFNLLKHQLESKIRASTKRSPALYRRVLSSLGHLKQNVTVYVGSFTEDGDSLSQWRAYTQNGIGFSLGFKDTYLSSLALGQGYQLRKCVYDEKEQSKIISRLIEKSESMSDSGTAASFIYGAVMQVAPLLKDPAFRDEKEWRIVSGLFLWIGDKFVGFSSDDKPELRAGKSMLIPYKKFKLEDEHGYLQVAESYLGPTPHVELAQASLATLVKYKTMSKPIVVKVSKVPYRSW